MACIDTLQPGVAYLYPLKTSENNLLSKYFRNSFVIHWLYFWQFAKGYRISFRCTLFAYIFPRKFSIINTRAIGLVSIPVLQLFLKIPNYLSF